MGEEFIKQRRDKIKNRKGTPYNTEKRKFNISQKSIDARDALDVIKKTGKEMEIEVEEKSFSISKKGVMICKELISDFDKKL